MADDRNDGDELFEDLDSFFAPIKDVGWDEPEAAAQPEPPAPAQPAPVPPRAEGLGDGEQEPPATRGNDGVVAEPTEAAPPADEAWYDTTVIESIGEIGFEAEPAAGSEVAGTFSDVTVTPLDEPVEEAGRSSESIGTETAPMGVIGYEVDDEPSGEIPVVAPATSGPSDEELEAAAAHFAASASPDSDGPELFDFTADGPVEEEPIPAPALESQMEPELVREPGPEPDPDRPTAPEPIRIEDDALILGEVDPSIVADLGSRDPGGVESDILSDLGDPASTDPVLVGSASQGLGGPSWQDESSVEVTADPETGGPGPGDRDVPAAFMTGAVLVAGAFGGLLIGKAVFAFLATVVFLLAQGEFYGVVVRRGKQPATVIGLVTGVLLLGGAYLHGEGAAVGMLALGVIAAFLWFISVPQDQRREPSINLGLTLIGLAWIPLLGSFLLLTLHIAGPEVGTNGAALVAAVVGLTFIFDTVAFLVGSVWGGQFFSGSLAPSVSPKKSLEGLIAGTLASTLIAVTLVASFVGAFENQRMGALLLGLLVAAGATFGDLAESLVKRDLGIKDMGSILPGHGGVLDRIDSLLFVAPVSYLLFRVLFT